MSCIAGLFHLGGSPVDRGQLEAMLLPMRLRAPDGESVYTNGAIGLAQCLLRTGSSGAESAGRLTLDGKVFIAADARIDGRAELLRKLRSAGRQVDADAPHAELILHAYAAFGDAFLDHLLGDFAFALWDAGKQKLICARDPLGIRPLYFFRVGDLIGFASDVEALRTHPAVSARTDRSAVADFLLLGTCLDPERTIYADIRRMPRATRRELGAGICRDQRYWELPCRETRYRSPSDYVEHFAQLFESAVLDRVPEGPLAIPLSGGMDSTSMAAVAAPRVAQSGFATTAYHMSSSKLQSQDQEQELAQMVADHLGVRMISQDLSDHPLLFDDRSARLRTPLPFSSPHLAVHRDMIDHIEQSGARVMLSGYAGDTVFTPSGLYCGELWRGGRWFKLLREIGHHAAHTGSLSGLGLRHLTRRMHLTAPRWRPPMPAWIGKALIEEFDLPTRWEVMWTRYQDTLDLKEKLSHPWGDHIFGTAESVPSPLVVRYPFLDIRLLDYLLSVPNHMLVTKNILRKAMTGRLPEVITRRPKTGLPGDPVRQLFQIGNIDKRLQTCQLDGCSAINRPALANALTAYRQGAGSDSNWASSLIVLPFAFEDWLVKSGAIYE